MALVSPGVEVTVIDESNYLPASTNSVPYILLATAQNKASGTGLGVAAGTLKVNAGKVYLITSQRDLAATFGNPFFYKTSAGTPINGYELNEYGLLAAHSVLGISNRAYIQRADIDLSELTATLVRPTGSPANGTYWLDTTQTQWGVFEWNQSTGAFSVKTPIVITDSSQLNGTAPKQEIGAIGDYAVNAVSIFNPLYKKQSNNAWVLVGSDLWKSGLITVQGTNTVSGSVLTPGDYLIINGTTVSVPGAGTIESFVSAVNSAAITGVTSTVGTNSTFQLRADSTAESDGSSAGGGLIVIDESSSTDLLDLLGIDISTNNVFLTPDLQQSYNYQVPRWKTGDTDGGRPTGSVWQVMNPVNQGANIVLKQYDNAVGDYLVKDVSLFNTWANVFFGLDPASGGKNIPLNTHIGLIDSYPVASGSDFLNTGTMEMFYAYNSGQTVVTGDDPNPELTSGDEFDITFSQAGTSTLTTVSVTLTGTTASSFVIDVNDVLGGYPVSAAISSTGAISFIHTEGGFIVLEDIVGTPVADAGFNNDVQGVCRYPFGGRLLSNFEVFDYTASGTAPSVDPDDGRLWYYSATNQVDIMIQDGGEWKGYRTVSNDFRNYNLTQTDPNGPIISASAPTEQSDGTDLVYGDLWIDTSDLEQYPLINRWENVAGVDQWVAIVNNDQTTSNGVLFADARWAPNGTTDPITGDYPTITSLLISDYLDIDAPDPSLYPEGILLWNTRRSGFNVKSFQVGYFNAGDFSVPNYSSVTSYAVGDKVLYNAVIYVCISASTGNVPTNTTYWSPIETNAWVNASGNRTDGSPYMGRKAVRELVVRALKSAIDTQDTLREEQNEFNLIACPQYPELMINMVALNNERSNTAFVVGDTPLRLGPTGNDLSAWATNQGGLGLGGEDGITTSDPYLAVFYPQCLTTDLGGSPVVQPASHMMLRTIVRNDEVAYPWLAPAGVRRGVVDNATAIGYVNAQTGEFVTIATGQGVRDVLYTNKINPITFIPGVGITNYGNKTESAIASALDRINVARLVAFIRGRLNVIGKQFVFEPNDQITRNEITNAIDGLMIDLVAKRGIYDYLIVCDESNNTPARIDRNELYVDIAIEPVKAVEFIYIPVRIKNTGEIAAGEVASSATA
jgi:hypothetical protein